MYLPPVEHGSLTIQSKAVRHPPLYPGGRPTHIARSFQHERILFVRDIPRTNNIPATFTHKLIKTHEGSRCVNSVRRYLLAHCCQGNGHHALVRRKKKGWQSCRAGGNTQHDPIQSTKIRTRSKSRRSSDALNLNWHLHVGEASKEVAYDCTVRPLPVYKKLFLQTS